jgi:uncharacterized membrane protein (Fun14 family)
MTLKFSKVVLVIVVVVVVVVVIVVGAAVIELNCEKKLIESITKVRVCFVPHLPSLTPTPTSQYDLMKLLSSL